MGTIFSLSIWFYFSKVNYNYLDRFGIGYKGNFMNSLSYKKILLGVTGSIAAYKSADLVRRLCESGAEVRVVMTENAGAFITPLTMSALSGREVYTDQYITTHGMDHIELARWCDVILIAPASANFIASLAHGMADSLLNTLCLATLAPILVAPAMNQQMWLNCATQANIETLNRRSIKVVGPNSGQQACGEIGYGRMLEAHQLVEEIKQVFRTGSLADLQVMVTAGSTHEAIDPVRYISNHSSGRMGCAIARAAIEAGANVTLISGAVAFKPPQQAHSISIETADQMYQVVMSNVMEHDIFIATAAVADYKCLAIATQKIKKNMQGLEISLQNNVDILAEVTALSKAPFTVGFAAETENLLENAQSKFYKKKLDMIAANLVGKGKGFAVDENELQVFWHNKAHEMQQQKLEKAPKEKLARQLVQIIADCYYEKNTDQIH